MPVFNEPDTIKSVSTATALRRMLDDHDVLPEQTIVGPHWHKKNGFGGAGKIFHEDMLGECAVMSGDSQQHIVGQEYRVISVGSKVVQAFRKDLVNDGWPPIPTGFTWTWVGVDGVRTNGVIPLVKNAVEVIPGGQYSVLGWDIIVSDDRPYILECNTSPGVNDATAERIYNAILQSVEKEVEDNG